MKVQKQNISSCVKTLVHRNDLKCLVMVDLSSVCVPLDLFMEPPESFVFTQPYKYVTSVIKKHFSVHDVKLSGTKSQNHKTGFSASV